MPPKIKEFLKDFAIEVLVYAVLVTTYFLLVLHLLGPWIHGLFVSHRTMYAVVALALIVGQGIVLELLTSALLRLIRSRGDR